MHGSLIRIRITPDRTEEWQGCQLLISYPDVCRFVHLHRLLAAEANLWRCSCQTWNGRAMREFLPTLMQSVLSPYNLAFALAVVPMLSKAEPVASHVLVKYVRRFVVALVVIWLLGTLSDMVLPNSITWTVLPVVALCLLFRDLPPKSRFCHAALFMCSWLYSLSIAGAMNDIVHEGIWFASGISLAYIAAVWLFVFLMERHVQLDDADVTWSSVIPLLAVCASGLAERAILILRSDFGVMPYSMSALESFLTCINGQIADMVVYGATLMLIRELSDRKKLETEQHLMQSRLDALKAYRESGDQLRILRHEVKNQYAYIRMLLEEKSYDRAEEFFNEMSMHANPTFMRVNSGNDLVDDIVNLEISKGVTRGVEISARIGVPPELPFEEIDLCSLLMNLLDNAIEAVADLPAPERIVQLGMLADQGMLVLKVENPCSQAPQTDEEGHLLTTKDDAGMHGYGTRLVRKIAQKYDGVADFSFHEGTFTAKAMLSMNGADVRKELHP